MLKNLQKLLLILIINAFSILFYVLIVRESVIARFVATNYYNFSNFLKLSLDVQNGATIGAIIITRSD